MTRSGQFFHFAVIETWIFAIRSFCSDRRSSCLNRPTNVAKPVLARGSYVFSAAYSAGGPASSVSVKPSVTSVRVFLLPGKQRNPP
jgi:hypothetical protein